MLDVLNRCLHGVHMGLLNPVLDAPVSQDGPADWYVPESTAHFTSLGITAPAYIYPCQEASGNLLNVGSGGTASLVPSYTTTPPTYQNTVTGWDRKGVGCIDSDSNNGFRAPSGVGPDPSSVSVAQLGYFVLESVAATRRNIMAVSQGSGSDANSAMTIVEAASGKIQNYCDGGAGGAFGSGVYDLVPATVAILTIYDRTNSSFVTYVTSSDGVGRRIVGQYFSGVVDGSKGIGAPPIEPTTYSAEMKCMAFYMWSGAAAEMSQSQVQTLFDALNIDRPWTVERDGPLPSKHVYLPSSAADYAFLGIAAPTEVHTFQETGSGDDAIGAFGQFNLTDGSTVAQNTNITESGWVTATGLGNRKCWDFVHNNGNSTASTTVPDISTQSTFMMGLVDIVTTTNSTNRVIFNLGGAAAATEFSVKASTDGSGNCRLQLKVKGVTSTGTADIKTAVSMGIVGGGINRSIGLCYAFTLDEWITATYASDVTDGTAGWGVNASSSPAGMLVTWDEWILGAGAEFSGAANETAMKNAIRSRLQALGHTVVW